MGEDEGGAVSPRPESVRVIKLMIVAAIVIAALVVAVLFVQDALRQPRIALIEGKILHVSCDTVGTFQTYFFSFVLVNSGDAHGFANVQFQLDGVSRANTDYFVPAGTSIEEGDSLQIDDCAAHTLALVLAAFWKA